MKALSIYGFNELEDRKPANEGLSKVGRHGPASAMGVTRYSLPTWDELTSFKSDMCELTGVAYGGVGGLNHG